MSSFRHIIAALLALSSSALAVDRPITEIEPKNCVTAECHVEVKASKFVHGPVSVNACDACHELTDAAKHTFTATRDKAELCTYCHEFTADRLPVVHKPVALGECIACHDPHGSATRGILREQSTRDLCGRCHESMTLGNKFVHAPVGEGACDACHAPHGAKFPKLVTAIGPDLCLACHDRLEDNLARSSFVHKGLKDGCLTCHDVHASNHTATLVQAAPDLCFSCHEATKAQVAQATHQHSPVMKDQSCTTCHAAHNSELTSLMKDLPVTVCMSCHDKKIDGYVAAVPEVSDRTMFMHGPIADGQCSGCHAAHGGGRPQLLTHTLTRSLYQPFARAQFELCFSCHDDRVALHEQADGITKFRDGNRNLHFVHANEGERGRNCRVCHATHAAKNPHNIRETFLYGKWDMPIGFSSSETGGSCDPGCHALYAYDREQAVSPTTAPATQPYPMIAQRPQKTEPHTWSASDITGATITVPDPKQPTVLLFARAGQTEPGEVLALLDQVRQRSRLVVILSGPGADEQAGESRNSSELGVPVIADGDSLLAAQQGVYGWPVTLVVSSDGSELARIRGTPQSLAMKLTAYLDFAAQRIDAQQLAEKISRDEPAEASDLSKKTQRMLATARQLLADGNVEQARSVLTEALKLEPRSAPLLVAMVDTLIELKQGRFAIGTIARIPQGAMPQAELDVLRARIYISIAQWPRAKELLEKALLADPNLAAAHLQMARVLEHEKNWQQAAHHYRLAIELEH
jgi:predicted CXXCH cytochrome family protein